jgi:hypothetical protein
MHVKAERGRRVLDTIRSKVESRLTYLVDEIVAAVDRNELESGLTDLQENSCLSSGRQEADQRSVGTTATPVDVQVEGQQMSEDLQSRCVSWNKGYCSNGVTYKWLKFLCSSYIDLSFVRDNCLRNCFNAYW